MNHFQFSQDKICDLRGSFGFCKNKKIVLSGAFEITDRTKIRVEIPRILGAVSVLLQIKDEEFNNISFSDSLHWKEAFQSNDIYEATIPIGKLGVGLYFSYLELESAFGKIYAYKSNTDLLFSYVAPSEAMCLQLSVSDFSTKQDKDAYGGIIYHIFVDRFCKSGTVQEKNGAILIDNWSSPIPELPLYPGAFLKNNYFYGGNLFGIIEKLDYIKSLGVSIIYLSPIFSSPSNHKYDTSDYMEVDSMFGGEEALKLLITSAKNKGIDIILDGVFNHTGADSIYFNKFGNYNSCGAYQSKNSPYYSWYDFTDFPNKYTCWWGINILPRINTNVPACSDFFVGPNGVIDKYSKLGIKGFRLDVADELSDEFIQKINERLSKNDAKSLLYGEVWEDGSNKIAYGKRKRYFLGNELDGVMNYPIQKGIVAYLRNRDVSALRYALTDVFSNAPERIRHLFMNLLGSHDTERIITAISGQDVAQRSATELSSIKIPEPDYPKAIKKVCMAYTILATVPGIPSIYYGDEVGIQGYNDPLNRKTFPWENEDKDLLAHYKALGKIRKNHSVYKKGDFTLNHISSDLLIFSRSEKNLKYVTVVNNSDKEIQLFFSDKATSLLDENHAFVYSLASNDSNVFVIKSNTILNYNINF